MSEKKEKGKKGKGIFFLTEEKKASMHPIRLKMTQGLFPLYVAIFLFIVSFFLGAKLLPFLIISLELYLQVKIFDPL